MIEWKGDGLTVKIYESSDEMPMDLYFLSQQYGIMDFEAGSSLKDIEKRFHKFDVHLANKQLDECITERKHLHQTFYNIINKVNFPSLQFGCHIQSVDGVKLEDYSDKNLMAIMERMGRAGFTFKDLTETLEGLKKKFNHELKIMFPAKYGESGKMNYLSQIKEKVMAELNFIITGDEKHLLTIKSIVEYFINLMKPKNIDWNSSSNILVEAKRLYEQLCVTMMKDGIVNPGQMSVMKFHIAVESYEKKQQPKPIGK